MTLLACLLHSGVSYILILVPTSWNALSLDSLSHFLTSFKSGLSVTFLTKLSLIPLFKIATAFPLSAFSIFFTSFLSSLFSL